MQKKTYRGGKNWISPVCSPAHSESNWNYMGNGTLSKIFNKSKKYLGLTFYKHFYSSECVDGCGGE